MSVVIRVLIPQQTKYVQKKQKFIYRKRVLTIMVPWWSVFAEGGRALERLLRDEDKIYSKVKQGIKILAREHLALRNLRDDLDAIKRNIEAQLKTKTLAEIRSAVRDCKRLSKAERRFKPIEEDIEDELNQTVTDIEQKLEAPSGTLQQVERDAQQVSRDLKIEAGSVLRGASRYEGKVRELLEQLKTEVDANEEEKAKETVEELLQLIKEIDTKWIPALVSDLDKAKEIEEQFIKNSGLNDRGRELISQKDYTGAARSFAEANKPKKVIEALKKKKDLTAEDYQLLKNAYIALRDREHAADTILKEKEEHVKILIAGHRRKELADFIEGDLNWIEVRCGATVLDCWEKLEHRLKSPPFNKLTKEDKEWLLGLANQHLDQWVAAARHYNASGDYRSGYYCWLRAGKQYQREAELTKGLLKKQKR